MAWTKGPQLALQRVRQEALQSHTHHDHCGSHKLVPHFETLAELLGHIALRNLQNAV